MSLNIFQKDKSYHEWDEKEQYNRYCKRSLYDSMGITLNRVAKETRKQPCFLESETRKDALYRLSEIGLIDVEFDLLQVLYDLYHKITHIPTKNKILAKMGFLMGNYNIEDPLSSSAIRTFSLIVSLANGTAFKEYDSIWDENGELLDIKVTVQDDKLVCYNDANVKEVIEFCIKEYRKIIKFIQKCIDENEITCEIVGDCYLDNGII